MVSQLLATNFTLLSKLLVQCNNTYVFRRNRKEIRLEWSNLNEPSRNWSKLSRTWSACNRYHAIDFEILLVSMVVVWEEEG